VKWANTAVQRKSGRELSKELEASSEDQCLFKKSSVLTLVLKWGQALFVFS
jgi:hypothetical protein